MAVSKGQEAVVQLLLGAGASISSPHQWASNPIHIAVVWMAKPPVERAVRQQILRILLTRSTSANVEAVWMLNNAPEQAGYTRVTPLSLAVTLHDCFSVRALLAAGAHASHASVPYLTVAVNRAVHPSDFSSSVDLSVLKVLLDAGANPNHATSMPLGIAISAGYHPAVKLLLDHGANPNMPVRLPGEPEVWPLSTAVFQLDWMSVDMLLAARADPDLTRLRIRTSRGGPETSINLATTCVAVVLQETVRGGLSIFALPQISWGANAFKPLLTVHKTALIK